MAVANVMLIVFIAIGGFFVSWIGAVQDGGVRSIVQYSSLTSSLPDTGRYPDFVNLLLVLYRLVI